MKTIPLSRGKVALVSDADYARLSKHCWHALKCGDKFYAARGIWDGERKSTVLMHREILNIQGSLEGDHKNLDTLDNRRGNLRRASSTQNKGNAKRRSDNKSGYKGVWWNAMSKLWRSSLTFRGRHMFLGHRPSKIAAARLYDRAAKKFFGRFARLNFPVSAGEKQ